MSQAPLKHVVMHWSKLVEEFQTSAKDFYAQVETALAERQIPGLKTSRIDWNEGGLLAPRREYLRITGGRYSFDVCAAPFGTAFFFSSWLVRRPARWVALYVALYLALAWLSYQGIISGVYGLSATQRMEAELHARLVGESAPVWHPPLVESIGIAVAALLIGLAGVALLARMGWDEPEAALLAVPGLGWFYRTLFAPVTYFKLDTVSMFRTAADGAVKDTIDGLLTAKGLRALTENDRKPVFLKFL